MLEGCKAVSDAFSSELKRLGLDGEVRVIETGCLGPCDLGPVAVVYPEGTLYEKVAVSDVPKIVEEHLLKGRIVQSLTGEGSIRGIVDVYKRQILTERLLEIWRRLWLFS